MATHPQTELEEIADDLHELSYHIGYELGRLLKFKKTIEARATAVRPETVLLLEQLVDQQLETYSKLQAEIKLAHTKKNYNVALKARIIDALRTLQGVVGALLVSADFQSPSYLHTVVSKAGTQNGKIMGTLNDYKRDRHLDAELFEDAFRAEYIDAPLRLPPKVFVTSSGMSAFTTILNALHLDGLANGNIVAGISCYFENKMILEGFFPNRLAYVDEMDIENVIGAIEELQPSVIFLDTLCNTETIPMPNMDAIIERIAKVIVHQTTIVIDNTGLAISYQPLEKISRLSNKLQIIVFESLNKYYQFGFDRVSGGVLWTTGLSPFRLSSWRMHLGTNMPDASVLSLPWPNRAQLEKRMARLNRNTHFLAAALDAYIKNHSYIPFSHVVYPGLESYPGFSWTKKSKFHGSFFVLAPKTHRAEVALSKLFIDVAIAEAKKRGVDLVAGTSFGFSTTRIYLTALHADKITKPFLRISVGTETKKELDVLVEIFTTTIDRVSKLAVG
ncbi:MAG: PLP-dependent transferase [Candidatus Magasanikbacteria bacterium]|nr:PLP-dependent transferase [Candidatus Magasanikbacteria bacterium]